MKIQLGWLIAVSMGVSVLGGQNANDTPEAHIALAKTAAGDDYRNLFNFLCAVPGARGGGQRGAPGGAPGAAAAPGTPGGGQRQGPPDRSTWYAEPVKVFDDLYFLGQTEYSVWAVTTSEGIIVVDTIFDYSVEEEVAGGLKKLGLDPATIKYAVVTHAHPDHHGGAKFLQDRYGTQVFMSAADWDFLDRTSGTKPKRDMVATDGQRLALGGTTLTLYVTPGHTPGTLSLLIPVKDNGKPHLAALWGGTGLNPDRDSLQTYIRSAERFTDIVRQAGADIILSNHTDWDQSKVNLPLLAKRAPSRDNPYDNPYIVGNQGVRRYLTVAEECATSRLMRLN